MKFFKSKTIRARLVKMLIFAMGGVAAIVAAVWRFSFEPALKMDVAKNQQEIARRAADQIREFIEGRIEELLTVVQIGRFWKMEKDTQREALYQLMKLDPGVHEISVVNREGQESLRVSRSRVYADDDLISLDREEKFRKTIQGEIYIGQVYHVPRTGPFVTLAVPIKFTATDIKGVMVAEISLKTLWDSISYIKVGKSGFAFVVDLKGNLIAHPDYSKVLLGINMVHLQRVREFLANPDQGPDSGEVVMGQDGRRVVSTFAVVKGHRWGVFVEEPAASALAEVHRMERLGILFFAFILAGVFGVSYWFSERIARPVRELEEGAKLVAQGNLEQKLKISTGDEIETLAGQFNQMAETLQMRQAETKRAEEALQARYSELATLHQVGQAILSSPDLKTTLEKILDKTVAAGSFDLGTILLVSPDDGRPEGVVSFGYRDLANVRRQPQEERSGRPRFRAMAYKKPHIVENVLESDGMRTLKREGILSAITVPVCTEEMVLGIVQLGSRTPREFQPNEVRLLQAIASQMGIAVQKAHLYEQTRSQALELEKVNKDLKRREEIQKLLKELSQDITSLDIDSLLKKLTEKVCEFLQVDITDVRLLEGVTWQLRGVSGIDLGRLPQSWRRSTSSRQRSIWIQENRRPLMIPDIKQGPIESMGKVLESIGIRGFLGVPILARSGEVIGILRALTYDPRHFTQEEVDVLQQLANGTAIALENARLLDETRKQTVELEKANKGKDEFLGFMSHELRTPLNVITGYTEMLRDGMLGKINAEQEKALGKMASHSKDLLTMISGILQATSLEAGAVNVKSDEVCLEDLLDELRSTYGVPLGKELALKWDYPSEFPVVRTDIEKLKHILENLINNAIKFTDQGHVAISARHVSGKKAVEFKVADTGIGIPEESLPVIFERFRQVDSSDTRAHGGVGLGLHVVKKFTEMLGGTVEVESEVDKGSTFTVTIPYNSNQAVSSQQGSSQQLH